MEIAPAHPNLGLAAQRACDACRTRKIRCDRASPCSPCRAANLSCRTERQGAKVHKQRVQVSKQYETKIDSIDHRLESIERLLLQQSNSTGSPRRTQPTPASSHTTDTHLDHATAATLSGSEDDSSSQTPAAGYIGAQAESLAATRVLEQTVGGDPTIQHDPELKSALNSLRSIVYHNQFDLSGSRRGVTATPSANAASGVVHPDREQVEALLRRAEGARPMMFNMLAPALFGEFCRKCRSMYEQHNESSLTDNLLIYSGLSNICAEFTAEGDVSSISYNHNLGHAFSLLLLRTLANFPLLIPASADTLEALLMATLTMIGMCKPSLSWSLTCKAVQMCQKLGYNRLSRSDPQSDPEFHRKVILFWAIYIMDRNISFRLGHAPAIQDHDIDTPMMTEFDGCHPPIIGLMTFWVDCGRVQGRICTQLYGPSASSLTPEERVRVAETLADELEWIHQRRMKANSAMMSGSGHTQGTMHDVPWVYGDDILHFSTLTTALYAIPFPHSGRFRAIEAARQCLRISRDLSNRYLHNVYNWTFCCHWVLLHAPLTTFTGIFYNVIANPYKSQEDVQLLEDFVASLEPARRLSDPIEKFYQLCSAFVRIAQAYVKAKAQLQPISDSDMAPRVPSQALQPAHDLYDQSSLTAGPSSPPTAVTNSSVTGEALGNATTNDFEQQEQEQDFLGITQNLQDWYSGNASLFGLLEQDISDAGFDFSP